MSLSPTLQEALERKAQGHPPWRLFDHRVKSPEQARRCLPFTRHVAEDRDRVYHDMLAHEASKHPRVLYIHIPYCNKICDFCGYCRKIAGSREETDAYAQVLRNQIVHAAKTPWAKSVKFEAVYFGGGTPTAIPADTLATLIGTIKDAFPLASDCEITVESRIDDILGQDIGKLKQAGVNRMSFGVQSFNDLVRQKSGRILSGREAVRRLELAFNTGMENICIDLIYGLPGQGVREVEKDLDVLRKLPVAGCSLYPLVLFENSRLKKRLENHGKVSLPTIRAELELFMTANAGFEEGWRPLTPVQYSRSGGETARYVTARARGCDILAFGAGAAGSISEITFINESVPEKYMETSGKISCPTLALSLPRAFADAKAAYRLSELAGISQKELFSSLPEIETILGPLMQLELVEKEENFFRLTSLGVFWAGNISLEISRIIAQKLGHV